MPNPRRARDGWLSLMCDGCRARLRIREAYAHLRGRCPECGYRIEAPRPRPFSPTPPSGAESFDLVPIEEEWPESAERDDDGTTPGGNYGMAATPQDWPTKPTKEPPPPAVEGYDVSDQWQSVPAKSAAVPTESYGVSAPAAPGPVPDDPAPYRLSRAEREPVRAPPPPEHPLLEGVYDFPWHSTSNITIWVIIALGLCIVFLFAAASVYLTPLLQSKQFMGALLPATLAVMAIALAYTGAYGGTFFLAVIEQTGAGAHEIRWPDEGLIEHFLKFGYITWLFTCASWPICLAAFIAPELLGKLTWLTLLGLVPVLLFPIFTLSSLSAQKPVVIVHARALAGLGRNLPALLCIYFVSAIMAAGCVFLAFRIVVRFDYLLTPVAALTWSACILIYARLLGRLAWLLSRPARKSRP